MGGGGGGSGGGVRECGGNSGKRVPPENGEPYLPKRDILTCVCAVRVHVLLNLRVSLSFFDVFPGLFFGQQRADGPPCPWLQIHHSIFSSTRFKRDLIYEKYVVRLGKLFA